MAQQNNKHRKQRDGMVNLGQQLGVNHSEPCWASFKAWLDVKKRFDAVKKQLDEAWRLRREAQHSCDRCNIVPKDTPKTNKVSSPANV